MVLFQVLFFSIFICATCFFIVEEYDIVSYVDDNTPYSGGETTENLMLNLKNLSKELFQWFYLNQIKDNSDRYHLLLSTSEEVTMNVRDLNIKIAKAKSFWILQQIAILVFSLKLTIFAKKLARRSMHYLE